MAEDLAIDVGIPNDTDEFDTFVSCVNNILDHGCGYSSDVTAQICERCETSELPIAKQVLRECRRTRRNTSGIRPSKMKWWQTWQSKHEAVPRWPGRSPSPAPRPKKPPPIRRKTKRPMSPMFKNQRASQRSPAFKDRCPRRKGPVFKGNRSSDRRKRPMSPMFKGNRSSDRRKRPMSPMFEKRRAPEPKRFYSDRYGSDDVSYERRTESNKKRRRYR
jgi:hypothetical protein